MIYSFSSFGYEGSLISVETDLRRGIPAIDIVGLADGSIKECRERVISAYKNSALSFPSERVLISLSPADIKKEGASFDLPLALSIYVSQHIEELKDFSVMAIGELELSGKIRPTKGIYQGLTIAKENGIKIAIIPETPEDLDPSLIPQGMKIFKADTLNKAVTALYKIGAEDEKNYFTEYKPKEETKGISFDKKSENDESLDTFRTPTQNAIKMAIATAISGRHHILTYGSINHSMATTLLQYSYQILPELLEGEKESVKRIYSLAGLDRKNPNIRPFRNPHQTASIEGICGGGINCRPGEISLSHNGILFLDEVMEFRTSVLQMLRVPLENKNITLCRAGRTTVYPADFQLFMKANSCPCGGYGSKDRVCLCSAKSIEQYWKKVSAPLLDRIEIIVNTDEIEEEEFTSKEELQNIIKRAWETQIERQGKLNSHLNTSEIAKYITYDEECKNYLLEMMMKNSFTQRRLDHIIKLSQTIADMKGEKLNITHFKKAFSYSKHIPLEM